ncbi:hypothetical protein [Sphingomonas sp. PvP018]|uniref:hypothetical protein n=1 Tax=Sphingomonas sp. PvP018 TaxID=2817852 RepID=UPI001FDA239D|nr:hypothetical protein [Sphingomonas sp. PvP018]
MKILLPGFMLYLFSQIGVACHQDYGVHLCPQVRVGSDCADQVKATAVSQAEVRQQGYVAGTLLQSLQRKGHTRCAANRERAQF